VSRYQVEIRTERRRRPFLILRAGDGRLDMELPGGGVLSFHPADNHVVRGLRDDVPLVVTAQRIEE
jgi:hypothetical protein